MKILWTDVAWEDYSYWVARNKKILERINKLIKDIEHNPCTGIGKPEPLKFDLHGKWSRRIDSEHRLVYEVSNKKIVIYSCRYHYK
jgi:toxin YoeB